MDIKEFQVYKDSAQSARHPWETARFQVIQNLLSPLLRSWQKTPKTILDVGCGDAYFLHRLHELWPNFSYNAVDSALTEDTCRMIRSSWGAAENWQFFRDLEHFPTKADLLLLLDVLEHIEEDEAFFNQVSSLLQPGGYTLLTVPAYQCLFSDHDRWLRHFRRYTLKPLHRMAAENGMKVIRSGYFFSGLVLPRSLSLGFEKLRCKKQDTAGIGKWEKGRILGRVLSLLLIWNGEFDIFIQNMKIPWFGLSCFILCQKSTS